MEFAGYEDVIRMDGLKAALETIFPKTSRGTIPLLVIVFGVLWFFPVNHLRVEWTLNPNSEVGIGRR